MTRTDPTLEYEKQLWAQGARIVAGVDEAGRGAWAGPVFAAAVVLPTDERVCALLHGVRDSKQMTARQRERWQDCIKSASVAWAVASASHQEIDQLGILPATYLAMQRAVRGLRNPPQHILVDYVHIPGCGEPQTSLPKGDCLCLSIAAASVLAKTTRDAFMRALDDRVSRLRLCSPQRLRHCPPQTSAARIGRLRGAPQIGQTRGCLYSNFRCLTTPSFSKTTNIFFPGVYARCHPIARQPKYCS